MGARVIALPFAKLRPQERPAASRRTRAGTPRPRVVAFVTPKGYRLSGLSLHGKVAA
jgi:hypothetical protein